MMDPLDEFLPNPDVQTQHEIFIHAPRAIVLDLAMRRTLDAALPIRFIFWLRAKLLGGSYQRMRAGLVETTEQLGWGRLLFDSERRVVMGAVTKPWVADVKFQAIPPADFQRFNEPGFVKIVWTLEVEAKGPNFTHFRTRTRVRATDAGASQLFQNYWRKFRIGIALIRWLHLPALKRAAEKKFEEMQKAD